MVGMAGKSTIFLGSVITLPFLAQVDPQSVAGELAIATAQGVLSIVVVAEAIAIICMFRQWRKDVETDRISDKEQAGKLTDLIANNTAVISQNRDATHRSANAMESFERTVAEFKISVDRNTEVIKKCDRHN